MRFLGYGALLSQAAMDRCALFEVGPCRDKLALVERSVSEIGEDEGRHVVITVRTGLTQRGFVELNRALPVSEESLADRQRNRRGRSARETMLGVEGARLLCECFATLVIPLPPREIRRWY